MSTSCSVPAGSWFLKSMPNAVSAVTSSADLSNAKPDAVIGNTCAPGGRLAVPWLAPGLPPAAVLPDQQAGNGVALGSGLKFGSTQPLNVWTLPSAPITGSFRDGF